MYLLVFFIFLFPAVSESRINIDTMTDTVVVPVLGRAATKGLDELADRIPTVLGRSILKEVGGEVIGEAKERYKAYKRLKKGKSAFQSNELFQYADLFERYVQALSRVHKDDGSSYALAMHGQAGHFLWVRNLYEPFLGNRPHIRITQKQAEELEEVFAYKGRMIRAAAYLPTKVCGDLLPILEMSQNKEEAHFAIPRAEELSKKEFALTQKQRRIFDEDIAWVLKHSRPHTLHNEAQAQKARALLLV